MFKKEPPPPPPPDPVAEDFQTFPFDPRFPNQNQTYYCYQMFLDFHRCQKIRGEEYEPCQYFKNVYTGLCPNAWLESWNEKVAAGTFPGRI